MKHAKVTTPLASTRRLRKSPAAARQVSHLLALAGVLLFAATPASAALINVGSGTIVKLLYYADGSPNGESLSIDLSGTSTVCNGDDRYAVPLDDRNAHIHSGLVAAFLAGKTVVVGVDDQVFTGNRCTITAFQVLP